MNIKIIKQGYDAFLKGKSEDSNPYLYGTQNYKDWSSGWIEAFTENI